MSDYNDPMKVRVRDGLAVLLLIVLLAGCAGAGPAGGGTTRSRCSPGGREEQPALVYIFCVESP